MPQKQQRFWKLIKISSLFLNTTVETRTNIFINSFSGHWIAPLALLKAVLHGQAFTEEVFFTMNRETLSFKNDYVLGGLSPHSGWAPPMR